jgi:hypothetical protein
MRSKGADERPLALGPTGRPLHPVGALFEAAFRRLGQRFASYLLYTVVCGLPAALVYRFLDKGDVENWVRFALVMLAYSLGHLALVGILSGLVTGELRANAGSIALAVVVGALVLTAASMVLLPVALAFYPFVVFGPIAAAAGDASGFRAIVQGVRVAWGALGRVAMVVIGLVIVGAFLWFGFVIGFSPLDRDAQTVAAIGAATLLAWPVAALVERNPYGDLTGRLVIRDAPGDAERMAELARRDRARD